MFPRDDACAVEAARGGGVERVDREARLAAARDAGDAGEGAERKAGGHALEVVGGRVVDGDLLAVALAAFLRQRDHPPTREIIGGDAGLVRQHFLERALRDDAAAVDACAGAHVDHVIGGADRVFVMLDHEHGVAEIAEPAERLEQHVIVALVQADAGFVEHVEYAGEAAADLAGEADALGFAAA